MEIAVVYVHGLWMSGLEGGLLRNRLRRQLAAETPRFFYPSIRSDISANAARLCEHLDRIRSNTIHLVGHSLGGLVIHEALHALNPRALAPGRVVLMGSPMAGIRAAQALSMWPIGRYVLGRGIGAELTRRVARRWTSERELGVIAGTRNIGLGRLVNAHRAPSDGTVYVDETLIEGSKDRLLVPVSHTGMPFSSQVAQQVAQFLKSGHFDRQQSILPDPVL